MTPADSGLLRVARRLDLVSLGAGYLTAWLIAPMVLSLTYEVISRYVFNAPTEWAYDMTFMLYGGYFMLGAAYTLLRKGHVRTDSLYAEWSPRRQAATDLACYLLMFLPFVGVFVFTGWGYFLKAYLTHETFVSSSWQPITWPFKLAVPVAGVLLLVQGLSECLKCVHTLRNGEWPDPPAAPEVAV